MSLAFFLRQLIGNAVRQQVHRKVMEAAQKQLASEMTDAAADLPRACDVAVVFALDIEAGGLEDLLEGSRTIRGHGFRARVGELAGRQVAVIRSGPGAKAARRATEAALDGHEPKWVISAGFAGALQPDVEQGDIVVADSLVDREGKRLAVEGARVPSELLESRRVHVGSFLTVERIVCRPDRKLALREESRAMAVEMESMAVAEVCQRRGAKWLAIRAVTDRVDEALPSDVEHLMRQTSQAGKMGAALGALMQRPGSLNDMLRLRNTALRCSDRLAKFIARLIGRFA